MQLIQNKTPDKHELHNQFFNSKCTCQSPVLFFFFSFLLGSTGRLPVHCSASSLYAQLCDGWDFVPGIRFNSPFLCDVNGCLKTCIAVCGTLRRGLRAVKSVVGVLSVVSAITLALWSSTRLNKVLSKCHALLHCCTSDIR